MASTASRLEKRGKWMKCHYEGTGYLEGRCLGTKEIDSCVGYERCATFKSYKMTNAERIRAMSDEELADFIQHIRTNTLFAEALGVPMSREKDLEFVRRPVKDGEE